MSNTSAQSGVFKVGKAGESKGKAGGFCGGVTTSHQSPFAIQQWGVTSAVEGRWPSGWP